MSQNVNVNLVPGNYPKEFHVSQYDVGRQLVANIVDSTGAYSIPSGATVTLVGTKPSGFGFTLSGTVGSGGVVTFSTTATVTAECGRIPCEIRITSGETVLGTANLMLIVEESPHQEGVIDGNSETVIPELTILVERVEAAASNVLDMQVEADTLPAGSSATYSYDEETNTATFGIPQGEAGAGAAGVVASAYSASSTYAVGDYVIHDGNLYRCTTAITTAEAFTAAHWTQVVLGDDVSNLKSELEQFTGNKSYTYAKNKSINYTNPLVQNTENGWESVMVSCGEGDVFYVKGFGGNNTRLWFFSDSNGSILSVSDAGVRAAEYVELIAPPGAVHLSCNNWYTQSYEGRLVYGTNLRSEIGELENEIKDFENNLHLEYINLFDPNTITEGKYIANDGTLRSNSSFFASDFIDVSEYSSITLSYTHIAHWYDSSKADISAVDRMNTVDNDDATVTVPNNAKYIRFSTYNTYLNSAQIGKNVSRTNYVAHNYYRLPHLITNDSIADSIIVDASGNGDYTSFTEAVYEHVDDEIDIIVKSGTYDIVAEYVAKFGQSVVDSLADSTSGINNFQYGIRIHDRKVTFESGAHLICDWTGHTVNGTHRFCALRIEPNSELVGLDLDCTATFYCIHDDYGTADDSPFTITYRNCRVIGHNLFNANCIGGGAHKYSRHILENCYFKNNVSSSDRVLSADVRYHNTNTAEAEPELYVSNCYFSNNMNVTYYGNQTTKFRAYVNNCFAPYGIIKRAESSSMSVDNVELYTWNNQTN